MPVAQRLASASPHQHYQCPIEHRVHMMPPGPGRWKERSRFFSGIAEAIADQLGGVVEAEAAVA